MVTDVPGVPNATAERVHTVQLVIIFVRVNVGEGWWEGGEERLWRVNTVSCSLPHCHDQGNRFYGQRGYI